VQNYPTPKKDKKKRKKKGERNKVNAK